MRNLVSQYSNSKIILLVEFDSIKCFWHRRYLEPIITKIYQLYYSLNSKGYRRFQIQIE